MNKYWLDEWCHQGPLFSWIRHQSWLIHPFQLKGDVFFQKINVANLAPRSWSLFHVWQERCKRKENVSCLRSATRGVGSVFDWRTPERWKSRKVKQWNISPTEAHASKLQTKCALHIYILYTCLIKTYCTYSWYKRSWHVIAWWNEGCQLDSPPQGLSCAGGLGVIQASVHWLLYPLVN